MADVFTPKQRSRVMASVRDRDTKPEIAVRSAIHRMGYRFRLHRRDLPGNPDIVLPRHHKVIFVNGCFWHGHTGCPASDRPTSNTAYWNKKLDDNKRRDKRNQKRLKELGWRVLIIWECEIKGPMKLDRRIRNFLKR